MRNKPVVCYDKGCLDGVTAAWLLYRLYPEAIFIGLSHPINEEQWHKLLKESSKDKELFIADFSPLPEKTLKLASLYKQVTICDHHWTEIKNYPKDIDQVGRVRTSDTSWHNIILHFTIEKCGAEIVYEKIVLPQIDITKRPDLLNLITRPDVLDYVRMADMGLTDAQDYGPIVSFIDDYVDSENAELLVAFSSLSCLQGISRDRILKKGKEKHAEYMELAENLVQNHKYTAINFHDFGPVWVPIVESNIRKPGGRFVADLGCEWAQYNPAGIFLFCCVRDGNVSLSIRTNGKPDAGEIAEAFGVYGLGKGGGHEKRGCAQFPEHEIKDQKTGKVLFHAFKNIFRIVGPGHKVIHESAANYAKVNIGALKKSLPQKATRPFTLLATSTTLPLLPRPHFGGHT
ncbi:MAG: hypothetical protein PHY92_10655 [Alphaproteobacteria bacterium]|nr:hypothetical protein [Alphaproteobacteria bacterium]